MATALTWFSASQLQQQTSNAVYTRADAISSTAAKGISDWISIRKSISTAFNAHIEAQMLSLICNKRAMRVVLTIFLRYD